MSAEFRQIHNALQQKHIKTAVSTVAGFSISGLATYVQLPELNFCIDMGECPLTAIPLDHVFLTHAHGDHARCIMRHHSLRKMMGIEKESIYYIPEFLESGIKKWIHAEAMFEGVAEAKFKYPEIIPVKAGEKIQLHYRKDLYLEPFKIKHSIEAMGGTLYHFKKKLKTEFLKCTPPEIIALRAQGVEITHDIFEPLVSFTGDSLGVNLLENPEIFNSKILITECTFLHPEDEPMSHKKGHTHIFHIVNALKELSANIKCEKIILSHFSMKYSERYIRETLEKVIPEEFKEKIIALI